jgi:hypothetical protein
MGKWLNLLRESTKTPVDRTDKTDKTDQAEVLSVLAVRPDGNSKIFVPDKAKGSVSFVSSSCEPFQDFCAFDDRYNWDDEDWQVAFDERAAILEFDQGVPREEAETLAPHQIAAERKRWLQ